MSPLTHLRELTSMPLPTTEPTTPVKKEDRVGDLPHRPRVLLGKMGLDGHDRGVKLIVSAAAPPERLYCGERLAFEFRRTASRLNEMQSLDYLGRAHRP